MTIKLETPIFGPNSAHTAIQSGASRLELNASGSYAAGGLTPTVRELAETLTQLQATTVPLRIMIRPRGAPAPLEVRRDFLYSAKEMHDMEKAICDFKASGLLSVERGDGFVLGVLREIGGRWAEVDFEICKWLVGAAAPFKCVFHRAFDEVVGSGSNWEEALDGLVACGFDGVLTSGGPGNACGEQNQEVLKGIVERAEGRIEVIAGGGVRSGNVVELVERVGFRRLEAPGVPAARDAWVHSSCLIGENNREDFDADEVVRIVRNVA